MHSPEMDKPDMDQIFKALADQTRRYLLDRLHEQNGQTLAELCEHLEMTRQSATQHLAVLEAANLVSTARRGREKLHYLNPVPLHDIQRFGLAGRLDLGAPADGRYAHRRCRRHGRGERAADATGDHLGCAGR